MRETLHLCKCEIKLETSCYFTTYTTGLSSRDGSICIGCSSSIVLASSFVVFGFREFAEERQYYSFVQTSSRHTVHCFSYCFVLSFVRYIPECSPVRLEIATSLIIFRKAPLCLCDVIYKRRMYFRGNYLLQSHTLSRVYCGWLYGGSGRAKIRGVSSLAVLFD